MARAPTLRPGEHLVLPIPRDQVIILLAQGSIGLLAGFGLYLLYNFYLLPTYPRTFTQPWPWLAIPLVAGTVTAILFLRENRRAYYLTDERVVRVQGHAVDSVELDAISHIAVQRWLAANLELYGEGADPLMTVETVRGHSSVLALVHAQRALARGRPGVNGHDNPDPVEVLRLRLAEGTVTEEEYDRLKDVLEGV